jgi:hypothetical protein
MSIPCVVLPHIFLTKIVVVVSLIELDLGVERIPVTSRWLDCKALELDLIQV